MTGPLFLTKEYHDTPPQYDAKQRQKALYLDSAFKDTILKNTRGRSSKAFISLAYSYFRNSYQFYNEVSSPDLRYMERYFDIKPGSLDWKNYKKDARREHKALILEFLGYRSFDDISIRNDINTFVEHYSNKHKNLKSCFYELAVKLHQQKIEIPKYDTLSKLITSAYKTQKDNLLQIVNNHLKPSDKILFDELFNKTSDQSDKAQQYRLTLMKHISQSSKPSNIKNNIQLFDSLLPLFEIAKPIISKMNINEKEICFYATSVKKQQIFQVKRRSEPDRYLLLLSFISNQFYKLQDVLVQTLLASVTTAYNIAEKQAKEYYYKARSSQSTNTQNLVNQTEQLLREIGELKQILLDKNLDDAEKVSKAKALLMPNKSDPNDISATVVQVKNDLDQMSGQALLYHFLEEGSLKLQRRCSDIVKRLGFDFESTNKSLVAAIKRYKLKDGVVDSQYPVGFFDNAQKKHVDTKQEFKSKLYKVLLFKHIRDAIKGGSLGLIHSYKYKHLELYLINRDEFKKERSKYIRLAELENYEHIETLLQTIDVDLHQQYQTTNENIINHKNDFIKTNGSEGYRLLHTKVTPYGEESTTRQDVKVYPEKNFTTISEVLNTVNKATGFLDELQHYSRNYLKDRPADNMLIASTIGLGYHFSPLRFAKLAKSINNATLVTTVNNYMSVENSRQACNRIAKYVSTMPITEMFLDDYATQTSSDGQKYSVRGESLNANRSFKYGGRDLVLSVYSHIDYRNIFYHSEVFSGSDREAHYMIDGVLRNEVVKSTLHSTDTHGYTEAIFGACHLLNISFAPRIKNIHRQQLYSLRHKRTYTKLKYNILPAKKMKTTNIVKYWDDILRLIASIKLGYVTASQVFKRLNSYSKDSNPLYNALKEFGALIKSGYVLQFLDDEDLRNAVQKQLNKSESGNKLDRALAIGRSDYIQSEKEDQEVVESCKRILKNAIVCWNYMYLTQKLSEIKDPQKREAFIDKIRSSSTVSWEHFLIHGIFDFSENSLRDSRAFAFNKMHDPIDWDKKR